MAYCPQCGVEYREGTTTCMDCQEPLLPGLPPEETEETDNDEPAGSLVRIRVFSGPTSVMQAELARNLLRTEGIPCVLQGQVMGEILPGVEPITMLVHESEAGRADEILKAFLDDPQVEPAE